MSEYWVSKKKYYCKYCEIYITDDAPSRTQHENGLRHKGNKERFVRGLYKASERKKKDAEEEKRDMARIDAAANAAFSQDVGAGRAKGSSSTGSSATTSSSKKPPPSKPSNPYANYTTAANLGYEDPDMERAKAEAEKRQTMGVIGAWEVIAPAFNAPLANDNGEGGTWQNEGDKDAKREAMAISELPVATTLDHEEDTRTFKLKKRTIGAGLGEVYDPGLIPIKVKKRKVEAEDVLVKKEGSGDEEEGMLKEEKSTEGSSLEGMKPKWTKLTWRRPGDAAPAKESKEEGEGSAISQPEPTPATAVEATRLQVEETVKSAIKEEVEDTKPTIIDETPTNLFRKRKAPASGAARR